MPLQFPPGLVLTAISHSYFSLSDYASDALTREPIDRSGPNFAQILSIVWSECLQNLSHIGLLVPNLGRHWNNSWDKNSWVLFQWRPNSRTNKPIWLKFCRQSLQPIDRICAKFGPDRSIGSRVRASLNYRCINISCVKSLLKQAEYPSPDMRLAETWRPA